MLGIRSILGTSTFTLSSYYKTDLQSYKYMTGNLHQSAILSEVTNLFLARKYSYFLFRLIIGIFEVLPSSKVPLPNAVWIITASVTCLVIGSLNVFITSQEKSFAGFPFRLDGCAVWMWSHIQLVPSSIEGFLVHLWRSFRCCFDLTPIVLDVSPM